MFMKIDLQMPISEELKHVDGNFRETDRNQAMAESNCDSDFSERNCDLGGGADGVTAILINGDFTGSGVIAKDGFGCLLEKPRIIAFQFMPNTVF